MAIVIHGRLHPKWLPDSHHRMDHASSGFYSRLPPSLSLHVIFTQSLISYLPSPSSCMTLYNHFGQSPSLSLFFFFRSVFFSGNALHRPPTPPPQECDCLLYTYHSAIWMMTPVIGYTYCIYKNNRRAPRVWPISLPNSHSKVQRLNRRRENGRTGTAQQRFSRLMVKGPAGVHDTRIFTLQHCCEYR